MTHNTKLGIINAKRSEYTSKKGVLVNRVFIMYTMIQTGAGVTDDTFLKFSEGSDDANNKGITILRGSVDGGLMPRFTKLPGIYDATVQTSQVQNGLILKLITDLAYSPTNDKLNAIK